MINLHLFCSRLYRALGHYGPARIEMNAVDYCSVHPWFRRLVTYHLVLWVAGNIWAIVQGTRVCEAERRRAEAMFFS